MKEDHNHPPSGCSISCVRTASSWGDSQTSKAKAFSFLLSVRASGTRKAGDEDLNGAYCLELCRLLLLQTQPTRAKLHVPCTGARTCGSLIPSKPAGVLMRPGQRVTFVSPPPWGPFLFRPHSRFRVPTANLASRVSYLPEEEAGFS